MSYLKRHLHQTDFEPCSWTDFCTTWLPGKRVGSVSELEGAAVEIQFTDGSSAVVVSDYDEGTPDLSEVTPGDPGGMRPPLIFVRPDRSVHYNTKITPGGAKPIVLPKPKLQPPRSPRGRP